MDNSKKTKLKSILSKYKNKSGNDVSKEVSFDSKMNQTIGSNKQSYIQDKKHSLNLIKEESELDNNNNSFFNSNFYEKLKENQIEYIETHSKINIPKISKVPANYTIDSNLNHDYVINQSQPDKDRETRENIEYNNSSKNFSKNNNSFSNLNKNNNEKVNYLKAKETENKDEKLNEENLKNNYTSLNSLNDFNFDSENTCKDMLEQVKKVVEYNTNFINRHNNNDFSHNSMYFNSNNANNNMIENINPLIIENSKIKENSNSSKMINKNMSLRNEKGEDIKNSCSNKFIITSPIENFSENISKNNSGKFALQNHPDGDSITHIINSANPFKSNSNHKNELNNVSNKITAFHPNNFNENNSMYCVPTGNFNENSSVLDSNINPAKILNNLGNYMKTSKGSRSASMNILQEYKISLDGKINNLKKIINQKMGFTRLKNLSNELMIKILQYFNTFDLNSILYMNSYMKHKIISILTDQARIIRGDFEKKFDKNFLLKNSLLTVCNSRKNRKKHTKINLVLQFKLTDMKLRNKTIIVGYLSKFFGEGENLKNFFRFDVRPPGPLSFWVMREYTSFHQDELNKAYFQHIMQFCLNDIAEININLFTDKGIMDLKYFKWLNINLNKIPSFNFLEFSNDHNKLREVLDFDLSRFCEMEIMKNKWTDLVHMENYQNILKKLKYLFEPNFIIQKVLWDDVGYHLFKIFLIAAEKGKLNSSDEVGIKITIKDSADCVTNEIKKNCLLFDGKNQIQLRIGDILVFYISKNK